MGLVQVRSDRLQRVVGSVKDQHLIAVLAQHVELVLGGVGDHVDQGSGNVDEGAPLIRFAGVHQDANIIRQVHRHRRAEAQLNCRRTFLVGKRQGVDSHRDGRGGHTRLR